MRHRNKKHTLNRPADQRKAMVRNMVTSLFLYGTVRTTGARARALVEAAAKLITRARGKDDYAAIRDLMQVIYTEEASRKALAYIKQLNRQSGFTRQTKIGLRAGDASEVVQVELITEA